MASGPRRAAIATKGSVTVDSAETLPRLPTSQNIYVVVAIHLSKENGCNKDLRLDGHALLAVYTSQVQVHREKYRPE